MREPFLEVGHRVQCRFETSSHVSRNRISKCMFVCVHVDMGVACVELPAIGTDDA